MAKKIGVKDIAAKAGVSIGTVDRVLHNRGEVKQETKDKILAIVDELGYKPNVLAKSLASKKTLRIAIVIPDSSDNNPYWSKPMAGIKKATEELANYNVEILFEHFDASSEKSFKEVLNCVSEKSPDGIVLNPVFKSVALHYISIFNSKEIPYVFIDVNIKGVGKLAYYGQDAEQSGMVAAKLMAGNIKPDANILLVKLSKSKVFSQHINSRVTGFCKFFNESSHHNPNISILEIDLEKENEPAASLEKIFADGSNYSGVFVPNSRVFKVAECLQDDMSRSIVIGYDLINQNIQLMKENKIDYLISQKPEEQAYKALMALFEKLVLEKEVQKTTYSPIDIIIKENIDYYKETKYTL